MNDVVYLNGDFIAKDKAKISVLDRGFLFADGIYEVIPVYNSQPFRLPQHLARLQYCLEQINLTNPNSDSQWQELISRIIARNGGGNLSIYVQITRGCSQDRNPLNEAETAPTVLIMPSGLLVNEQQITTTTATLLKDIRWQHCDIKSIALLANILLRNQAEQHGFGEAILHRDGVITEGSSSNVFMVKNHEVYTPMQNNFILGGVTREVIIEIAQAKQLKVHQQDISVEQLLNADEVWICSSSREISPVTAIDDKMIANGDIGAVTLLLHHEFQTFKKKLIS